MIPMLDRAVQDALAAGFSGLCACGEMSWVLDEAPGSNRLAEYEARLNDFYRVNKAIGLCLYDRSVLPSDVLDHSIATHRHIHLEGPILLENPFYEPDDRAIHRRAADAEIVIEKIDILEATRTALMA